MKSVIFCGAFLSCFMLKTTYAQVTAWTEPPIVGNKDGSETAVTTVKEDGTGTFPTIAATASGTLSYSITMQTPAGVFQFNTGTAGLLELAMGQSLDYETNQEHVLVVEAVDGSDATATGTGTATVNITIVDVNETPVVTPARTIKCLANGAAIDTTVATISATDPDTTGVNSVITSPMTLTGNTNSDFTIDANGVVTVANVLDKTTTLGYLLEVEARDTGAGGTAETATATIVIYLEDSCSGAVMLAASLGVTLLVGLMTSLV